LNIPLNTYKLVHICSSLFIILNTSELEDYKTHITYCFTLISNKLHRGSIASWDTYDFSVLSKSIHEETGTLLSVSTLKRLSGRVNYSSKPNSNTLDALAKYVGFNDWRDFLKNVESDKSVRREKQTGKIAPIKYRIGLLVLILVVSLYFLFNRDTRHYNPDDFSLSVKSIALGLPNTVIFKYDATIANDKDKIEIQQNWDKRKKVVVSKNDSISTSIYYKPGFFKSKLVVNDSILQERDVFIPSNGWLGTIETDSLPIYLNIDRLNPENALSINIEKLKIHGINPFTDKTIVGLYQVQDFGAVFTDDFELSTSFRNDFKSGNSPCQMAQLTILSEDGPIALPVCNIGCVSEISLFAFNKQVDGKKNDLSNFGVNYTDYVQMECTSRNQKLTITINGKPAYTFDVPKPKSKIIGVCFFFEGAGTIKNITLKKDDRIIYDSKI